MGVTLVTATMKLARLFSISIMYIMSGNARPLFVLFFVLYFIPGASNTICALQLCNYEIIVSRSTVIGFKMRLTHSLRNQPTFNPVN